MFILLFQEKVLKYIFAQFFDVSRKFLVSSKKYLWLLPKDCEKRACNSTKRNPEKLESHFASHFQILVVIILKRKKNFLIVSVVL